MTFGNLKGLISQPLKNTRPFKHPYDYHHAHQQEDNVPVYCMKGLVPCQDVVSLVEVSKSMSDQQHQSGAEERRKCPVQNLKSYEHIDCDKHNQRYPECSSLESL